LPFSWAVENKNSSKNKIISIINKGKYGFVPDPREANSLQRINESPIFCRLKECIGNHWSLNLVKVGMYIMELNDEGERKLIKEIRDRISKKYGPRGMKIIDLGSTGVIFDIIDYLDGLRMRKGYGKEYIASEFEKMLDNWYQISIFVKSKHDEDSLYNDILDHMYRKFPIFFVFAYGSASNIAMKIIAEMNNQGMITERFRYIFWVKPGRDKAGMVKYAWDFELCT
jgi:hypothetical protein